ncbi:MAG TPA: PaaI family thioesterase [Solirubrobacteraceae bacterium]|nr:PaaI family thioesterase [Solirubrobacteraceae bacterium]
MNDASPVDGHALIRAFLEQSPFGNLLGLELRELRDDHAELGMRFDDRLVTAGQTTHGGAISALIDTTATAASWATSFPAMPARWGTASLTVDFVRAAEGRDLVCRADVVRRGRSLCHCTAEARDDEGVVATGLVVYALS